MAEEKTGLRLLVQIEEFRKVERAAVRADAAAARAESRISRVALGGATAAAAARISREAQRDAATKIQQTRFSAIRSPYRTPTLPFTAAFYRGGKFQIPTIPGPITQGLTVARQTALAFGAATALSVVGDIGGPVEFFARVGSFALLGAQVGGPLGAAVGAGLAVTTEVFNAFRRDQEAKNQQLQKELEAFRAEVNNALQGLRENILVQMVKHFDQRLKSRTDEFRESYESVTRRARIALAAFEAGE